MQTIKNAIKRQYGLIGYPLEHSFSEKFFNQQFIQKKITDASYSNFPIKSITQLPEIIKKNENLLGLSVTSPYKQLVMKYLDIIHSDAESVNAVNLIKITRGEKNILEGFNTDIHGFSETFRPFLSKKKMSAIILGTGGAAKAVEYALLQFGIKSIFVSRSKFPEHNNIISYQALTSQIFEENRIIINATPLGMYPETENSPPVNFSFINKNNIVFDLIYNPAKTTLLEMAENQGAIIINGEKMLYEQAKKAWEILEI